MKFFFDRCVSIKLCRMIAILEDGKHQVVHHDQDSRFTQTTADTEWLNTISRDLERPIVVSGDCRILKRPDEIRALQESGLSFFLLADNWSSFPIHDMVWKFVKVWPMIVKEAAVSEPTVFKVSGGSSLKIERFALTRNVRK